MITYLGKELDRAQEHELKKESPGFVVEVVLGPKYGSRKETFHNITEVHWIYPTNIGNRVALESDVHFTGFTHDIDDVISLNIVEADKVFADV